MRKAPRQQRSRVTVDAIVEAATRVLAHRGWARFTTNEIAAVAGVSVGSLYQYFPNKEALVAALVARHNRDILQLIRNAMKEVASSNLATAMRALVKAAVDAHLVDSALHRIFAEQVPRMGQLAKIEALQRETFLLIRAYLEERRDEISVRDLDSATFICVTTAEALTHEYVINKPDALADDRERFIDEVTRLLMGYLTPGSTPRAGPRRPAAGRVRSA